MFKASTPSIPVITLVIVLTSTAAASPYKDAVGIEREVGVVEGRATCLDPTVAAARVDDCANSYAECLYRQGQDLEARYQGPNHFDLFVLCRNVVRITHGHGMPPPLKSQPVVWPEPRHKAAAASHPIQTVEFSAHGFFRMLRNRRLSRTCTIGRACVDCVRFNAILQKSDD